MQSARLGTQHFADIEASDEVAVSLLSARASTPPQQLQQGW